MQAAMSLFENSMNGVMLTSPDGHILAAAPGIVRAHRGAFIVNSKPKQGTTIRALLPLRETEPVEGPSTLS